MPAVVSAFAPGVLHPVLHQVAGPRRRPHPVAAVRLGYDRCGEPIGVPTHVMRSDPPAPDPAAPLAAHSVYQRMRIDEVAVGSELCLEGELALLGTGIEPTAP